ncbi:MAG: DUF4974 domain-containing protein [Prolixibacteraceae bacterium]|jgi:ferric-dicitrate binding protein FerR (iron transport regulator)|nr:DUF4974 domain-containing protein [Prolixibacteraceae bacterium]
MNSGYREIEELLPGYFSGDLSDRERAIVDEWRIELPGNELFYQESKKAWEAMSLLGEMEQFNSFEALNKVNARIFEQKPMQWLVVVQRAAAVLLLPLLFFSGYTLMRNSSLKKLQEGHVVMQSITSRQGMVTKFELSDGTKVWLNSGSELKFPTRFTGDTREVVLNGEAYFDVTKNKNQPFRVNANKLNVEVLGTSFNVVSFNDETQSEVVLVTGQVALSSDNGQTKKDFGTMHSGQRAIYKNENQKVYEEEVQVDKYIAWKEGNLIFRDDKMEDVVKRLSRWFNVEIIINDPEIKSYIYKATFRNETLTQVLHLLKISAPIDYRITGNQLMPNGEYAKQKVYLMKKKI